MLSVRVCWLRVVPQWIVVGMWLLGSTLVYAQDEGKSDAEAPAARHGGSATEAASPGAVIELREFLVLPKVGVYGRGAVHVDAVEAAFASGAWKTPKAGEVAAATGRQLTWKAAAANNDGALPTRLIQGGYAATQFESPAAGVMLLEATGHAAVYVNDVLHAGDPYGLGWQHLPVNVQAGANELVFHVAGPELKARLVKPAARVMLFDDCVTLPSIIIHEPGELWASIAVANTTQEPLTGAKLVAQIAGRPAIETPLDWLDSASIRNASFRFAAPDDLPLAEAMLEVRVVQGEETLATTELPLQVVEGSELQVRTFRSRIDGSVQSYAVLPAAGGENNLVRATDGSNPRPGAILALHGAGVSAVDFVKNYQPKPWAHVIAPTGRGLYGFDWEDWARMDAFEALDDAPQHFEIDARRVYVTGHAMGGHGALALAVTSPDRFAAVGASAAWSSLWNYGGGMPEFRDPTPVQALLQRVATPSNTLALASNLQSAGVYLLHGADDQRVPVEQSRLILGKLSKMHDDFAFYEQPDAGNWWGPETVDWPEMMEFFAARTRNDESPASVAFAAADLGVSASHHWVTIAGQEQPFAISRVALRRRESPPSIVGTTENVTRLSIDKSAFDKAESFLVRLDGGQPVAFRGMPASGQVWLEKRDDRWRRSLGPKKSAKGPQRYGGFKAVFDHNAVLVYGTTGNEQENVWARAKAHFDAETFRYRGAGSLQVIPDKQFRAGEERDRSVVLYGNAETNSAWPPLLSTSPVQARRGRIDIGGRPELGGGLGYLMVRPRPGSDTALVGVVGGTGLEGMRLTNRLRYFISGVAYPDLMIFGPELLTTGDAAVRAAGFFADDWDLEDADIAWRDLAL